MKIEAVTSSPPSNRTTVGLRRRSSIGMTVGMRGRYPLALRSRGHGGAGTGGLQSARRDRASRLGTPRAAAPPLRALEYGDRRAAAPPGRGDRPAGGRTPPGPTGGPRAPRRAGPPVGRRARVGG